MRSDCRSRDGQRIGDVLVCPTARDHQPNNGSLAVRQLPHGVDEVGVNSWISNRHSGHHSLPPSTRPRLRDAKQVGLWGPHCSDPIPVVPCVGVRLGDRILEVVRRKMSGQGASQRRPGAFYESPKGCFLGMGMSPHLHGVTDEQPGIATRSSHFRAGDEGGAWVWATEAPAPGARWCSSTLIRTDERPADETQHQRSESSVRVHEAGEHGITDLADVFSISRPTVYRTINRARSTAVT